VKRKICGERLDLSEYTSMEIMPYVLNEEELYGLYFVLDFEKLYNQLPCHYNSLNIRLSKSYNNHVVIT
jgi:hypothetical protein